MALFSLASNEQLRLLSCWKGAVQHVVFVDWKGSVGGFLRMLQSYSQEERSAAFYYLFFFNLMFIWYFKGVKKTEKMDFKRQKTN